MTLAQKIRTELQDPFKSFRILEIIIAAICITLPLWLFIADTKQPGELHKYFRGSISDYVYMQRSYIFGMLLCMAAMLFVFNGSVYFKKEEQLNLKRSGKWYNIILGVCLLGVILFPHGEYPVPHYTFAIAFFVGNAIVIGVFHEEKYRAISLILAILTMAAFVVHLVYQKLLSVFWAEWISLTVIGVHQILQAAKVIRFAKLKGFIK